MILILHSYLPGHADLLREASQRPGYPGNAPPHLLPMMLDMEGDLTAEHIRILGLDKVTLYDIMSVDELKAAMNSD